MRNPTRRLAVLAQGKLFRKKRERMGSGESKADSSHGSPPQAQLAGSEWQVWDRFPGAEAPGYCRDAPTGL